MVYIKIGILQTMVSGILLVLGLRARRYVYVVFCAPGRNHEPPYWGPVGLLSTLSQGSKKVGNIIPYWDPRVATPEGLTRCITKHWRHVQCQL